MQANLSVVWLYVEGVWVRSIVTNPSDYGGPFGKIFSNDSTFGKVTNLTYQISLGSVPLRGVKPLALMP